MDIVEKLRQDDDIRAGRSLTGEDMHEAADTIENLRKALRWHIRAYRVDDEAPEPEAETDRLMAKALEMHNKQLSESE